jgi:hypothetical protein
VNVFIMANALASILALFKFVRFICGFIVDWFVVD